MELEKLKKAEEAARAIYIQQAREVSGYESEEQRAKMKAGILASWKAIQSRTALLVTKGREYNCKFDNTSAPTVQQPSAAVPSHSVQEVLSLKDSPSLHLEVKRWSISDSSKSLTSMSSTKLKSRKFLLSRLNAS